MAKRHRCPGRQPYLPNINPQVGAINETVEITAGALEVPTDTAEVSTTLNQTLVESVPILGRDAGELIKLMPGAASTNGLSQGSSFTDKTVGTNTGPVGSYSINGTQPYGSMSFMLDGANLVDPGNAGTQIANINQDMVSEVKMLMSSYSAEYAKGPVIFQAFSNWLAISSRAMANRPTPKSSIVGFLQCHPVQMHQIVTARSGAHPSRRISTISGGNVGGPVIPHGKKLFFGRLRIHAAAPAGSIHNTMFYHRTVGW
jgi:hypothetical protein